MALVDEAGTVVERYDYDDFGTPYFYDGQGNPRAGSAYANRVLFTGRTWEAASGFYDYRTRWYDPKAGRFTSRDSIGLWGDPANLGNGYAYVANNPGTWVDPWGLQTQTEKKDPDFAHIPTQPSGYYASPGEQLGAIRRGCEGVRRMATFWLVTLGMGSASKVGGEVAADVVTSVRAGSRAAAASEVSAASAKALGAGKSCPVAPNSTAAKSFFEGTRYTPKVLKQMEGGVGEFHSFPESVAAFESTGKVRTITGGDKVVREVLEIPGSYSGKDGVFQFIKNPDGTINHRLFVPNQP